MFAAPAATATPASQPEPAPEATEPALVPAPMREWLRLSPAPTLPLPPPPPLLSLLRALLLSLVVDGEGCGYVCGWDVNGCVGVGGCVGGGLPKK